MPVKLVAAVGFAAALICVPADASEAASPPARVALPTSAGGDAGLKPGVFLPIGDQGAFRLDGVRVGQHRGVPVRFLDITLKNAGTTATFPRTLQEVWWQGRLAGENAQPLRRDATPFGMFDQTVAPGGTLAVTYAIPDRPDVAGVTLAYPQARPALAKRVLTWRDLTLAADNTAP